jgi:DNA-binding transcriptional LysR family regulator
VRGGRFDQDIFAMRNLNLDQLRTLVEVVECGSFSAAARRLNLTQPAVSMQIRELERRLGVRLIERMGKRAHATAPCRELMVAAQGIFRECDLAYAAMRRFRDGQVGQVHVGTSLTAMVYRLPPIVRKLRVEYPGIDVILANMPTQNSIERIIANTLDLALVTGAVDNAALHATPLLQEAMVAILPADTRGVPEEISPEYIARQPLILLMEQATSAGHAQVMGWLAQAAALPRQPMPLGTIEALKAAVASNVGMAVVPEMAVAKHAPDLIVRPLRPALSRTLTLIERHNKPNAPALDIVRTALLSLRNSDVDKPATAKGKRRPARAPALS